MSLYANFIDIWRANFPDEKVPHDLQRVLQSGVLNNEKKLEVASLARQRFSSINKLKLQYKFLKLSTDHLDLASKCISDLEKSTNYNETNGEKNTDSDSEITHHDVIDNEQIMVTTTTTTRSPESQQLGEQVKALVKSEKLFDEIEDSPEDSTHHNGASHDDPDRKADYESVVLEAGRCGEPDGDEAEEPEEEAGRKVDDSDWRIIIKKFACAKCSKKFFRRADLAKHAVVHSDARPFQCAECGRVYKRKRELDDHSRLHTGRNLHACDECNKKFVRLRQLRQHALKHDATARRDGDATPPPVVVKNFACSGCQMKFATKCALKAHAIVHRDEFPFRCNVCGRSFKRNSNLKLHTRTHNGEKPYSCPTCHKAFSDNSNRLRHVAKRNCKSYCEHNAVVGGGSRQ